MHRAIVGLGEVLWDVFPDGAKFGGAPANFAASVAGLLNTPDLEESIPFPVYVVSAVGNDELGFRAIQEITSHGIQPDLVVRSHHATGKVLVHVDDAGHASYEFARDTAWDNLLWSEALAEVASRTAAVCFGTLGQRSELSRQTIRRFIAETPVDCLRIFDINLRSPFWTNQVIEESIPWANVLKCNEDELPVLADLFQLRGSAEDQLRQLVEQFELHVASLTRGAGGALLVGRSNEKSELPSLPTTVVDTVGAGDAFTAAIALGLLNDKPLDVIHELARRIAAFVCSQSGATPTIHLG